MNIKNRFTVAVTLGVDGVKIVRGVYDHLQEKHIDEKEAERICFEEYGEQINLKKLYVNKIVDIIKQEISVYNKTCEKGFEITFKDVIENFKTNSYGIRKGI